MYNHLRAIAPYLHSALVSSAALSRLYALGYVLPSFPVGVLECRLNADEDRVDLSVGFPVDVPGIPETLLWHPTWRIVQTLRTEWSKPGSFLNQKVHSMWLELDIEAGVLEMPPPCIIVSLIDQHSVGTLDDITQMTSVMLNRSMSSAFLERLRLCVARLPAGAYIGHMGAMWSRAANAVRLVVNNISPGEIGQYMGEIGWPYPAEALQTGVSEVANYADYVAVSFDIGEVVSSKVGLECYFYRQPDQSTRWQLLLDYLCVRNMCSREKRNAMLAWPGVRTKISEPELWSAEKTITERFLDKSAFTLFTRTLNHVKITFDEENPLEAKAYVRFDIGERKYSYSVPYIS